MLLSVEHHFAFEYDGYISESFLEVRVQPKTTVHQTVHSFLLAVGPPSRLARYVDWNDNVTHHFNITRFHDRIEVLARSVVSTHPQAPAVAAVTDVPPFGGRPYALLDFLQLGGPVPLTPALRRFHRALKLPRGAGAGALVEAVGGQIHRRFTYRKDVTRYDSTTEDFLRLGAGVCQDFTHLALGSLRLSGIPCRYVSGYLHVDPAQQAEPAQSHAWIEFWSPSHGWIPFDPTHNRPVDERYIVVGHGRTYDDVPPNRGIYRGSAHERLQAEVRTSATTQRVPLAFQEGTQPIDLPVFKENPGRAGDYDLIVVEAAAQQQQQ
ncbi:MAG: transglutaminase family protein [Candidatus Rokubacteria bacterium]|nr:transglutaminase family protein [Candidatus Rokubacteria bacterium]